MATKGHVINVVTPCYALLTDEEKKNYETPVVFSKAMTVKVETETSTETLSGDGADVDSYTGTGKTTIEMGVNDVPLKDQAVLLGHHFDSTTGAMSIKAGDTAPYVALGWALEKSNGKKQYRWYYKGKFEEISEDVKQIEGGKATFSTPTLKGTFTNRVDGFKACKWDEDEGTAPAKDVLKTVTEPPAAAAASVMKA